MAKNLIGDSSENEGEGRWPDQISREEIQGVGFEIAFRSLGLTAAQLRLALLSEQDATRLTRLLFDWLLEIRHSVPNEVFDRIYHQLRRALRNPDLSKGDKAYQLRISLEQLFAEVRTCVEFPLAPILWDPEEVQHSALIGQRRTRRDFFRAMTLAFTLLVRAFLRTRPPGGPNETT